MKTKDAEQQEHLPALELIREYPKANWLVIGGLTHAKKTSAQTQLKHFKDMMHALGYANGSFARRLHWIVRVGGHPEHIHLHFLLGKEKLTNGHKRSYSPDEVVKFIKKWWKRRYGMEFVELFDSSRPGIKYVLRREPDGYGNETEMSEALAEEIKKLRKQKIRDEFALEILECVKVNGARAGFGDEMEQLRRGAA